MPLKQAEYDVFIAKTLKAMALPFFEGFAAERLSGDGSDRDFYRVVSSQGEKLLFVFPSPSNPKALLEAKSCYSIGSHLSQNLIPVPRIHHYDDESGVVVYEDLGDTLLHFVVRDDLQRNDRGSCAPLSVKVEKLYQKVLDSLVRMQVKGVRGFAARFCWESPKYSRSLMLERESGYFIDSYCRQYLGVEHIPQELENEFLALADRVSRESSEYLMHRDFQSRNIMVKDGDIHIIDFQGARFGPLGYDLASLLNDPYVHLSRDTRFRFISYYLDRIKKYIYLDPDAFLKGYYHIALQRNLQVLGAFSFLSKVKGKRFFEPYIKPAFIDLQYLLHGPLLGRYPVLAEFTKGLSNIESCKIIDTK